MENLPVISSAARNLDAVHGRLDPGQSVSETVRVTICPRPFSDVRVDRYFAHGVTIQDIMDDFRLPAGCTAGVCINGVPVPKRYWDRCRANAGTHVTINVVPMGGDGKNPFAIILMLAFAALSFYLPVLLPSLQGIALGLARAAIGLVGNLITNAIAPPPQQKLSQPAGIPSPTYSITGIRNQFNHWGVIPRVYGTHKAYPPFGAPSYTELVGEDQFLRSLFIIGYGPLEITDIKIGQTPIDSFNDVEYVVRPGTDEDPPLSLMTNTIIEDALNIDISAEGPEQGSGSGSYGPGEWVERTTATNTKEIMIDLAWPNGLFSVHTEKKKPRRVEVEWQYRAAGSEDAWINAPGVTVERNTVKTIRRGARVVVSSGQYDVRIRVKLSSTPGKDSTKGVMDRTFLTAFKSVRDFDPLNVGFPVATIEMRIRANEQLNNIVDELNCVVTSVLPDWDAIGEVWTDLATSNPASVFRSVLQGLANKRPQPDARIDLDALQDWHEYCDTEGFTFNGVLDTQGTVFEVLRNVASTGRAGLAMRDNKFSVVIDRPQSTYVQRITPRNSWGFSSDKTFITRPHAIKARFVNANENWQQDERIIYDDGFNAGNATDFESIDLPYITDPDLIWRHGRFHLAQNRLRPELYSIFIDVENIVMTRGDRVEVAHDVLLIGLAQGRVKSLARDGNNDVASITLDQACPMEAEKSYGVRLWFVDGTRNVQSVVTEAGDQYELTFTTPIDEALVPADDDLLDALVLFGEADTEAAPMIVHSIVPAQDMTAQIFLQDAGDTIHDADTGEIPAFITHITQPPPLNKPVPTPVVQQITSDESALLQLVGGNLQTRVIIYLNPPGGFNLDAMKLQVRYRRSANAGGDTEDASVWEYLPDLPGGTDVVIIDDVEDAHLYDLNLRYVAIAGAYPGAASDWYEENDYLVIGKSTPPADVTGFSASHNGAVAICQWNENDEIDLQGYIVRYMDYALEFDFENAISLSETLKGTEITTGLVPPGEWNVGIKAVDVAGNLSVNANVKYLNVQNASGVDVVVEREESPRWEGTLTNCIRHWSGVIVPESEDTDALADDIFDEAVVRPADAWYEGAEFDIEFDDNVRTYAISEAALLPDGSGIPQPKLELDYKLDGDEYDGFEDWSISFVTARYLKHRVHLDPSVGVMLLRKFKPVIDVQQRRETETGLSVADTGEAITFNQEYHNIPHVLVSVDSDTALIPTYSSLTTTGFTAHVFDTSGTEVGITDAFNYTAKGN